MADISQIRLPSGDTFDLIDEKSGYITAQYIENKTDYSIPVSRVGEIVVGETAIGTDSTNFPTSKAVVDYVDERVVQEMEAIDVGVTGIKANGTNLPINNGVVNIPGFNLDTGQTGLFTNELMNLIGNSFTDISDSIPTSTSQLYNDSGFITVSDVSTNETDPTVPAWAKASTKPTYTASEVGALPDNTVIPEDKVFIATYNSTTYADTLAAYNAGKLIFGIYNDSTDGKLIIPLTRFNDRSVGFQFEGKYLNGRSCQTSLTLYTSGWTHTTNYGDVITRSATISSGDGLIIRDSDDGGAMKSSSISFGTDTTQYLANNGTWQSIPIVPTNISSFTNDAGYITSYTETDPTVPSWAKASSKPSYGLTEISGTDDLRAIEGLTGTSGLLKKTAANTWTLDTSTYLTSYTETDPTVPSWAKQSSKPTYTAAEVGALPDTTTIPSKTSDLTNDSGFITGYTETDPVFSASAAAGITSTDISNWNEKVSDDKTWNGVNLAKQIASHTSETSYVPGFLGTDTVSSSLVRVTRVPTAHAIAKYDANSYLYSTTPSANDNSTKVATTAYVDAAIPKVYSSTNTGGYLTMATLPIYNGTVE